MYSNVAVELTTDHLQCKPLATGNLVCIEKDVKAPVVGVHFY